MVNKTERFNFVLYNFKIMSKADRTRQFIIETSAPIINKKGMAGTSLSDIMGATKLAKGGIYGNFESKEEICHESYLYLARNQAGRLDGAINKGKTAKEKFFNLLDAYATKNDMGGCPILNFGIEADDTNVVMKENVKRSILNSQKRIFTIISDGIYNNEISEKIDAKSFSIKVFAMIEGAILCRRVTEDDEQTRIILQAIRSEFENYLI